MNGAIVGASIAGALGILLAIGTCNGCSGAERSRALYGNLLMGVTVGAALGGIIGSL